MSKHLITDDDAIELMDFLFKLSYNEDGEYDSELSSMADYLFSKLSTKSGRDSFAYFKDLVLMKEMGKKK